MTQLGENVKNECCKFSPLEPGKQDGAGDEGRIAVLNYRRTLKGKGRTKKPGRQGTVKNPCLLELSPIASVTDMDLFFCISCNKPLEIQLRCKEKQ